MVKKETSFGFCNICHAKLTENYKKIKTKKVCQDCYNKEIIDKKEEMSERIELFSFLSDLFDSEEIPEYVVSQIDTMVSRKEKTYSGIKKTIEYYYTIKNNVFNSDFVLWAIRNYYPEAEKYFFEQYLLQQKNENFEIVQNVQKIRIKKKEVIKKPKYKIEDL